MDKRLTPPPNRTADPPAPARAGDGHGGGGMGDTGDAGRGPPAGPGQTARRLAVSSSVLAIVVAGLYIYAGTAKMRVLEQVAHVREGSDTPLRNPFHNRAHESQGRISKWVLRHRPFPFTQWNVRVSSALDHFDPVTYTLLCEDHDFTAKQWRTVCGLQELRTLSLRGTNVDDRMAASLPRLGWLAELDLSETAITDIALKSIGTMDNLEYLFLTGVTVTDRGLRHLAGMKNIRRLEIGGTSASDACAPFLSSLPDLKVLSVEGTAIGDAGVAAIAANGRLESFTGDGLDLTDASLSALARCPGLTTLSLDGSKISDDGLRTLAAGMPQLRDLSIDDTAVTDSGVASLGALENLNFLSLRNTKVTRESVAVLQHENSGLVVAPVTLATEFD